ncbi:uncharacterized protein LOC142776951 [Rhipicephalus microplus]|uniref:uncharacterized protein LOC142776951 n=1 Tax=Rhipicephalus microplus TaxID=6941 RepID=UPI003F6B3499
MKLTCLVVLQATSSSLTLAEPKRALRASCTSVTAASAPTKTPDCPGTSLPASKIPVRKLSGLWHPTWSRQAAIVRALSPSCEVHHLAHITISSVVSGTLRGQGRRLLSELSHLPAKSITWHTSQSAQWSLAPYVVKAGGYCQSSLTFLRSPSPGTHHNQEIFQERMAACAPALFQMMEEAPTKHTMELVVRVRDEGQREKAVQVAVLPFLCAHFKEDKNYLYQVFEEGTSITEKLAELPSTPTIIALGINMLK